MAKIITRQLRPVSREGQATLSLVFLIGGMIILVGVSLAFLVIGFLNSGYGFQAANRALAVASSGADDALLQLARDRSIENLSGYSVPLGSNSATVTITQNSPENGKVTILSTATVQGYRRKIKVIASIASSTGEVSLSSWTQQTL